MPNKEYRVNLDKQSKPIDKNIFENLCKIQCTLEEIAAIFSVSVDKVQYWIKTNYFHEDGTPCGFIEVKKALAGEGRARLRQMQWKTAEKSVPMQIWLGKQYLGQRDNAVVVSTDVTGDDDMTKAIKESFRNNSNGPLSETPPIAAGATIIKDSEING